MGQGLDGDQGLSVSRRPSTDGAVGGPQARRRPGGSPARRSSGAPGRAARVAGRRLPRLAGGAVRRRVLAARHASAGEIVQKGYSSRTSETLWSRSRCTARSSAARSGSPRRHHHRRGPRLPHRVLHGEGRDTRVRGRAGRRGADAAVVELPGEGLRVADHPSGGGILNWRSARWASPARASATWPPGSSSPTCGCRT